MTMSPMAIFYAVCSFWILSEIFIGVRRRSAVTGAEKKDRMSLVVLWIGFGLGPFLGGMCTAIRSAQMPATIRPYAFWGGLALVLVGIGIRWIAIATLKRFFTVDVAIAADQKVIQTGPYRFVRHPSYAGSLLSSTGLGLAFLNWISFAVVVIFSFTGIAYRIAVEEQALMSGLGDDYREYAARTKRLIPGVF
jgi:protein-S-isoprenylcysteine O-methyltransferase Ste14